MEALLPAPVGVRRFVIRATHERGVGVPSSRSLATVSREAPASLRRAPTDVAGCRQYRPCGGPAGMDGRPSTSHFNCHNGIAGPASLPNGSTNCSAMGHEPERRDDLCGCWRTCVGGGFKHVAAEPPQLSADGSVARGRYPEAIRRVHRAGERPAGSKGQIWGRSPRSVTRAAGACCRSTPAAGDGKWRLPGRIGMPRDEKCRWAGTRFR